MCRQKSSVNVAVSPLVDAHVCEYYSLNLYTPLALLAQALAIDFLVDLSPKCDYRPLDSELLVFIRPFLFEEEKVPVVYGGKHAKHKTQQLKQHASRMRAKI